MCPLTSLHPFFFMVEDHAQGASPLELSGLFHPTFAGHSGTQNPHVFSGYERAWPPGTGGCRQRRGQETGQ